MKDVSRAMCKTTDMSRVIVEDVSGRRAESVLGQRR